MYKLTSNSSIVQRLSDGAFITGPSQSQDWIDYTSWIEAGNTPEPYITLAEIKTQKIDDLDRICEETILSGFGSSALGSLHWYDSDIHDQINILGSTIAAGAGSDIPYKCLPDGQSVKEWKVHTPSQMMQVFSDGVTYKIYQLQKLSTLKAQVDSAVDENAVNAIVW